MHNEAVGIGQVAAEHDKVCAVAQLSGWEQQPGTTGPYNRVAEEPGWRNSLLYACDPAPIGIPVCPICRSVRWIMAGRQVRDHGKIGDIGGKRCRLHDGRALPILCESRFGLKGQVESRYSRAVKASAMKGRTCAAQGVVRPPRGKVAVVDGFGTEARQFQPLAPFDSSSRCASTALACPSATSSAAVRSLSVATGSFINQ